MLISDTKAIPAFVHIQLSGTKLILAVYTQPSITGPVHAI